MRRRGVHPVQDPEKLKALFGEPPNLSYAAADVEDPDTVKEALRGCRGVIFAASGKGYFSAAKVDNQVRVFGHWLRVVSRTHVLLSGTRCFEVK